MLTGLADAIVSANRLRSAAKGAGYSGASGNYPTTREDQPGKQWY